MKINDFFCSYYKNHFISLKFYYSSKNFKIVYIFILLKVFYNLTSFVFCDIAINILFTFKSHFYYQNILIY